MYLLFYVIAPKALIIMFNELLHLNAIEVCRLSVVVVVVALAGQMFLYRDTWKISDDDVIAKRLFSPIALSAFYNTSSVMIEGHPLCHHRSHHNCMVILNALIHLLIIQSLIIFCQ